MNPIRIQQNTSRVVAGDPNFLDIVDAVEAGIGGVVVGEGNVCVPAVFRLEWPQDIQDMVCT